MRALGMLDSYLLGFSVIRLSVGSSVIVDAPWRHLSGASLRYPRFFGISLILTSLRHSLDFPDIIDAVSSGSPDSSIGRL